MGYEKEWNYRNYFGTCKSVELFILLNVPSKKKNLSIILS